MKKLSTVAYSLRWLCLTVLLLGGSRVAAQPNANFSASDVYVCAGTSVAFTNLSTGATGANWFENGVPFSNQTSPNRFFSTPGSYTITLVANDGVGADTVSTLVQVNPSPSTSFNINDASCFGVADGDFDLTVTSGTPKGALCFDGVDDFVDADEVGQGSFGGGITIEGWVKPDAGWTSGDGMVAAFNTQTGGNQMLFSYNTDLQKFIYFDGTVGNQIQNGLIAPRGQWHHVALTISSTNVGRMYVNGTLVKSFVTGATWQPNNSRFSLGQEYDGTGTSQHFFGCMAELRVWNAALTAQTINNNFNNICTFVPANHPNINNLVAYYSFNESMGTFVFDRSGNNNHGTYNGSTWGPPPGNNYSCFSAGTGFIYNWSNGPIVEDQSGLAAGTYTVTITDAANCMIVDSVEILEPAEIIFSVSASPTDTLCVGDTVSLLTSGAYTFTYSPAASLSASTGASVSASPTATTTYTVIAENNQNCTDTAQIELVVNALPNPAIAGNDTLCLGDSTTLVASGGVGFQWNTGANVSSISVAPGVDSTYQVLVTDTNGCEATASYEVIVNALPVAAIAAPAAVCLGDTANLTASGGATYVWNTNDSTASIAVVPAGTTTYSVVATDNNGCTDEDSVDVTVNALPSVAFGGDTNVCVGNTATVTASGGNAYQWNTGDTTAAIVVTPTMTTTYTVVVTDSNGCSNGDSVALTVNPLPMVMVAGDGEVCAGDPATLTASGGTNYQWDTGDTTASIIVSPTVPTDYTVQVTDGNGCTASDTFAVGIFAQPNVMIASDDTICPGDTATLIASGAVQYGWNFGDTSSVGRPAPTMTTVYFVTGMDTNGCTASDSATVFVFSLPNLVFSGDSGVCEGNPNMIMVAGASNYVWNTGDTTDMFTDNLAGDFTYVVTGSDSNGCSVTDSTTVLVYAPPAPPTIIQSGAFIVAPAGFATYQWSLGGNPIAGATDSTYLPTVDGTYSVEVTDSNGCSSTSLPGDIVGQLEVADLGNLVVYPNPNSGQFALEMDLATGQDLDIRVVTLVGQVVHTESHTVPAGRWVTDIALEGISTGIYLVEVRSEGGRAIHKLIVE